jgi:hypothetical protein
MFVHKLADSGLPGAATATTETQSDVQDFSSLFTKQDCILALLSLIS